MSVFVVYESATGIIVQYGNERPDTPQSGAVVPSGCSILEVEEHPEDNSRVNLATLEIEIIDPLAEAADWGQVKQVRDQIESSPITVPGQGTFDVDDVSLKRMELALANFNDLPTVVDGKLTWKRADNSFVDLTMVELQGIFDNVRRLGAIRAADLHQKAEVFFAASRPRSEIQDWATWGY